MYDTHVHLNDSPLLEKVAEIIKASQSAGIQSIIIASSNLTDSQTAVQLARQYPSFLFASVGIHPQNTDPNHPNSTIDQLGQLDQIITSTLSVSKSPKTIVAIGECGLDFTPSPPGESDRPLEEQQRLFLGQIDLAIKYKLPLIVHARQAYDKVIDILSDINNPRLSGVFHCYMGGRKRIPKIPSLPGEWYFGFDGNLTYDEGLQTILPLIPQDRSLIETDSPWLSPFPLRNQTNTPANLVLVQQKINQLAKTDLTKIIASNTLRLFNLIA